MSGAQVIQWFAWGFFMGLGWSIASWLWGKLTERFG